MPSKKSVLYFITQQYLRLWHGIYYRKIKIIKHETIPHPKPVIYAPNHQNALMDPLAILLTDFHQPYFLARADIFKNPIFAFFLNQIKILPVYRIRDGAENLNKNQEIFNKTGKIFQKGSPLGIFPEANHSIYRRLRPLKKGVPRIAFLSESTFNWELDLQVVPVGIYYSDIQSLNQELFVIYGKAIPLSKYREIFEQNPVDGHNALRKVLSEEIQKLIVDIQSQEHYEYYENLRLAFSHQIQPSADNPIKHYQDIVKHFETIENENPELFVKQKEEYSELVKKVDYKKSGKMIKDYFRVSNHKTLFFLLSVLLFPFAIVGYTVFALPHWIVKSYTSRSIKDPCFVSTIYFAFTWILFSIWIILIGLYSPVPIGFWGNFAASILIGWITIRYTGILEQIGNYFKTKQKISIDKLYRFLMKNKLNKGFE